MGKKTAEVKQETLDTLFEACTDAGYKVVREKDAVVLLCEAPEEFHAFTDFCHKTVKEAINIGVIYM